MIAMACLRSTRQSSAVFSQKEQKTRYFAIMLAGLSGIALPFASAPFDIPTLAFLHAPLLMMSIELLPKHRFSLYADFRSGFGLGLFAGLIAHMIAFSWFAPTLIIHKHFPWPLAIITAILFFFIQSLPFACVSGFSRFAFLNGIPLWIFLPASMSTAFAFVPMIIPWHPGTPTVEWNTWAQIAELSSETFVDFMMALIGCLVLEAMIRRRIFYAFVAIALLGSVLLFGVCRIHQIEKLRSIGPTIRVRIVQPHISIEEALSPNKKIYILNKIYQLADNSYASLNEITILPETSYPYRIRRNSVQAIRDHQYIFDHEKSQGSYIFGAVTSMGGCNQWNSSLLTDENGQIVDFTDKTVLLPFGEYIPFWKFFPWMKEYFPCSGYQNAQKIKTLRFHNYNIGVLICYEDLLSEYTRQVAVHHPDFLINLTNDTWFLDSQEPHLHHMAARFRAIETRRDLVRAVNSGISGLISATGERIAQTQTFQETTMTIEVHILHQTTTYIKYGNFMKWIVLGFLILLMFTRARIKNAI